jgi:thioredoxin 1
MSKVIEVTGDTFEGEVIQSKRPTLVDFYADYCAPCKILRHFLSGFADQLRDRAKVVTVDAVANPGLSQYYRISAVPTLIIFKNGKETTRFAGLVSEDVLQRALTGDAK